MKALTQGCLKRIHVNQHDIRQRRRKPLRVKWVRGNEEAKRIDIFDRHGEVVATVVYQPEKPLSCGARCWIETRAAVHVH